MELRQIPTYRKEHQWTAGERDEVGMLVVGCLQFELPRKNEIDPVPALPQPSDGGEATGPGCLIDAFAVNTGSGPQRPSRNAETQRERDKLGSSTNRAILSDSRYSPACVKVTSAAPVTNAGGCDVEVDEDSVVVTEIGAHIIVGTNLRQCFGTEGPASSLP